MNEYLLSTTAVVILVIICVVAFLFIARLVMRVAIKAAFALAVVFALLLTGAVGWWRGWFSTSTPVKQANQQPNVNRNRR